MALEMGMIFFLERFHAVFLEDFQSWGGLSWDLLRRGAPGIGKSDFAMERLTLGLQERVSFVIIHPINDHVFFVIVIIIIIIIII